MTRFIHTADWHILDTQYGRRFRGEDLRAACRRVIEIAIERKVDFILNGGDTLHFNRPSETMFDFLFELHVRLQEAGIPMYTVTGNHDSSEPSFLRFPGRSANTGNSGIVCIDHQVIRHGDVTIAGYPAISFGDMVDAVRALDTPPDIVCWHGAIQELVNFPMNGAGSLAELPAGPRAWLLGDIHLRGTARCLDDHAALVSYPGTVEMIQRGEPAKKFVDIYELAEGWRSVSFPDPQPVELKTRPVLFLTVGTDEEADQALSKIRDTITKNPDCHPLIFANYDRSQKTWANRVMETIDPRTTVFRASVYRTGGRGIVQSGKSGVRPELLSAVNEVLPPGTPLNDLARLLVMPAVQHRQEIVRWVETQIETATPGAPASAVPQAPATSQEPASNQIPF